MAGGSKDEIKIELKNILNDTLPVDFSRTISSKDQYIELAKQYGKEQVEDFEKWQFDDK